MPSIYPQRIPLHVEAWQAPDEPVPFATAVAQRFEPFEIGSTWGKAWSTTWFRVTGRVPQEWLDTGASLEVVVDLGFRPQMEGGQAEGLAYRPDGSIIKAIEPFSRYLPVEAGPDGALEFYIEAAANPEIAIGDLTAGAMWTPSTYSTKDTVPDEPIYQLRQLDLAVLDTVVWELNQDIEVLASLAKELPQDSPRRGEIASALNRAIDVVDPDDVGGTAASGRDVLSDVLARPAHASAHRIVATGHAHIDSAWLWPVRETVRKCARTFTNVLNLMEEHDELVFACSSAQQYAWMKEYYPQVWERIKGAVAAGRFVPVGGMWVESDTNMPGSEAMARQFVLGKRFFAEELGVEPLEVWLPDSFGYSAALPQLARAAGARSFLTQKLSWNETNVLPHHTFLWEGIDGTRIFTHFPPVDTYNSKLSGDELAKAERQYKEHGHGSISLVPFGYGDGGGGPTREMIAKAARTADLEGSPRVRIGTPAEFFVDAEAELARPAVWHGELYLETHRGTYTSQLRTKQGNRRSEHLLQAAELWAATASVRTGAPYPSERLRAVWETVLLQQFHDILAGSSIGWVHREAEANYARVATECTEIIEAAFAALSGSGENDLAVNSAPVTIDGLPPFSISTATAASAPPVTASPGDGDVVFENGHLRMQVDGRGLVTSLVDVAAERELVPAGRSLALLQIHNDRPTMYEAWDIDEHYRRTVHDLVSADRVELIEGHVPIVRVHRTYRSSRFVQEISLRADSPVVDVRVDVDWQETRKLVKLAFPLDVQADEASSEIQFGHVKRPTHVNTSWDQARYETVAHRWVHIDEGGYGAAVVNDSTYGHDIQRQHFEDAGVSGTTVRLSLIRGPKFPDPEADRGNHTMRIALVVGAGLTDAQREAWRLNQPVRLLRGARPVEPLVQVHNDLEPGVIAQAIKLAEDGSGDVVVRLYEASGRRSRAGVLAGFDHEEVVTTDLLERTTAPRGDVERTTTGVRLEMRPFEIVTLRFIRAAGTKDNGARWSRDAKERS
ncbi:alpha-mannosidase [Georgenia sp. TF02-10]|uniref:alpha-mannosidase n=1 Tax=Georgenia sp. TF02-10 TaxID=2917725 RepID=UPI00352E6FCF